MRRLLLLALLLPLPALAARLDGVVEGYYGRPWSGEARRDVVRFLGRHGLRAFVYGPKNDDFHRTRWREPYPPEALADLGRTARAARRARVRFVYALSPVLDICYSCDHDFAALTAKLDALARVRVRHFALFLDDAPSTLTTPADVARYGGSDGAALARAQADLANRTGRWLRAGRRGRLALVVPTEYAGTECLPYHAALDAALVRGLPVGWTGAGVFVSRVTADEARARARCLPRHPVVLWDNYPVNDTVVSNTLHLGPLTGRDAALPGVLRGHLLNPMTQPHASLIAVGTAAAYLRRPRTYDPERAWRAVLDELGGGTGLAVLAAQTRSSFLDLDDARELAGILDGLTVTYEGGGWEAAVDALVAEETRQADAPADIAVRLGDTALAGEVAPWVQELAAHAARGLDAAALLRALKPALAGVVTTAAGTSLRVRGRALGPDLGLAASLGPDLAGEGAAIAARIASPPAVPYLACLGALLTADIGFCPEQGLNVHGKSLYFVIRSVTEVEIVADRNVHDRLVRFAGEAWTAWQARRGAGSDALAVTLNGQTVALGADGRFDATVGAAEATLAVSTAAGETTVRRVP